MLANQKVKGSPIQKELYFAVRERRMTSHHRPCWRSSSLAVMIHYYYSLPSLIVKSEFLKLLGPKFTRKFGFLHRIANSNTLCLLNSPLEQFFGSIQRALR